MSEITYIVEDDKIQLSLYEKYFSDRGLRYKSFLTAENALEEIDNHKPSLIILDIELPGINAFQFLEILRNKKVYVPIIVATVSSNLEDKKKCIALGVDAFLTKPIQEEELFREINFSIENFEMRTLIRASDFNHIQRDFVKELSNIGMGLGASKISEIANTKITLDVSFLNLLRFSELKKSLNLETEINYSFMNFKGEIEGKAYLVFNSSGMESLTNRIMEIAEVDEVSVEEMSSEVGNIVLNSFLGTFSNSLNLSFKYSTPESYTSDSNDWIKSIQDDNWVFPESLVISTNFNILDIHAVGNLVLIMNAESITRLKIIVHEILKSENLLD